ncbi:MAG: Smr/MutS family protein [Erythrobacter sp.]
MNTPRGLSEEEATAWAKLAHSVTPLEGRKLPPIAAVRATPGATPAVNRTVEPATKHIHEKPKPSLHPSAGLARRTPDPGLDGHWDRRLKSGAIVPDFTLDLHGHTLDSAHARLDSGLDQARAMDARVVLLIAGKSRPVDPADRGQRRGAIRAKILDWLAAGPHGSSISAIRKAHRRHGGEGALYLILKRRR